MQSLSFMQYNDLDLFFKNNNYDISRATITRYGQMGIILDAKSKKTRSGPSDSRVYYNPLTAIETMTAFDMIAGNYKNSSKIARFTYDDVFWTRLYFYIQNIAFYGYHWKITNYNTSVRLPFGEKYVVCTFPMQQTLLQKLVSQETCFDKETEPLLYQLWEQHQQYLALFGNDKDLFDAYVSVANQIYSNLYLSLLEQYAPQLNNFDY